MKELPCGSQLPAHHAAGSNTRLLITCVQPQSAKSRKMVVGSDNTCSFRRSESRSYLTSIKTYGVYSTYHL